MAQSASILYHGQPIGIVAIKEAVGMDTVAATFEMGMVHLKKQLQAEQNENVV